MTEQGTSGTGGEDLRQDRADGLLGVVVGAPAALGIAPEIAAIEDLLYPVESEAQAPSDGTEPTSAPQLRHTVGRPA